jgi:hypothetical protein
MSGMPPPKRSFSTSVSDAFHSLIGRARLALLGAGVILRILLIAPRPAFVVELKEGKALVKRGKVQSRFLRSCEQIAADCAVREGTIRGIRRGRGISLAFSRALPESTHQRFRNAWILER